MSLMSPKTITWVSPVSDMPDQHGNYYINVAFADETVGFIGAKPENLEVHYTALAGLKGQEGEFDLEERGTSKSGRAKYKIVSYPGKHPEPEYKPAPVKKDYTPAWRNTEEGFRLEQRQMNRRTALMQSVAVGSGITLELAEKFYRWLEASGDASLSPDRSVGGGLPGKEEGSPPADTREAPASPGEAQLVRREP